MAGLAEDARRAFYAAWQGDIEEVIAEDYHDHDMAPGLPPTREGFRQLREMTMTAFPDFEVIVEDAVASDDRVALRITNRGTNTGPFMGNEPTGARCEWRTYTILRMENGRFVERWGMIDLYALFSQLGLLGG